MSADSSGWHSLRVPLRQFRRLMGQLFGRCPRGVCPRPADPHLFGGGVGNWLSILSKPAEVDTGLTLTATHTVGLGGGCLTAVVTNATAWLGRHRWLNVTTFRFVKGLSSASTAVVLLSPIGEGSTVAGGIRSQACVVNDGASRVPVRCLWLMASRGSTFQKEVRALHARASRSRFAHTSLAAPRRKPFAPRVLVASGVAPRASSGSRW